HANGLMIGYVADARIAYATDIWSPGAAPLPDKLTPPLAALVAGVKKAGIAPAKFAGGHGSVGDHAPLAALEGKEGLLRTAREPEARVGGAHVRLGQAELAAHDVGALDQRDALVVRDAPAQPLAPEAAVGRDHQPLGRDVLERLLDQARHVLGRLDDRIAMVHHADADLLVGPVLPEQMEIPTVRAGALERDHVAIELEQMGQRPLVARRLPVHALLVRVAPAGVHPDLGVDAFELAVERLRQELELGVGAVRACRAAVMRGLLDLDQRTARSGQLAELGVHDVAEIVDERLVVAIVL